MFGQDSVGRKIMSAQQVFFFSLVIGNFFFFFFGSINRQIQTSDTIKQNSVVSNRVQVVSHFNNWRMLTIHLVVIFNTSEEIIGLTES